MRIPTKIQFLIVTCAVALSCALLGCSKKEDLPLACCDQTAEMDYLISLGFSPSSIQKVLGGYIVENDMFFSSENLKSSPTKQYAYGLDRLVSYANQNQIRLNPIGLNSTWTTGLDQAVTEWNNLLNCRISFSINPNNSHVTIAFQNPYQGSPTSCATADIPASGSGLPGTFINLKPSNLNLFSVSQIKLLFMHELGHVVGYEHSNNVPASSHFFVGTAINDNKSFMDWDNCSFSYVERPVTYFDRLTAALVYPEAPPLPYTIPLFRYRSAAANDHFYTKNWSEQGGYIDFTLGSKPYYYEGISCYVGAIQFPGTQPLLRYRHGTSGTHLYSLILQAAPYIFEGNEGFVYSSPSTGTIPLLRYRQTGTTHYVYTATPFSLPGWYLEGPVCYVFSPPTF